MTHIKWGNAYLYKEVWSVKGFLARFSRFPVFFLFSENISERFPRP